MTEEYTPLNEAAFKFPKIRVVPVSTKDAKFLGPSTDAEQTPPDEGDAASLPSLQPIER